MKIYFKQSEENRQNSVFNAFGITECYFKQLYVDSDSRKITRKAHHHNGFEIHIIENGYQEYEADGKTYRINSGEFFFIPPFVAHKLISSASESSKFSLTFASSELSDLSSCVAGKVPPRFFNNAQFIIDETRNGKRISPTLIESDVFECVVLFLRLSGLQEQKDEDKMPIDNYRLAYAKEYISDNIESRLTVTEIASYCYISSKQLTRTFLAHEGMTPAQYIITQRIAHIEKLLADDTLSLKTISEKMNFQNEYYFNSFVKKYLGMPPGTYRRMLK